MPDNGAPRISGANCPIDPELVSVIIPAYNRARYIREAISSVIGQSYPALELLVHDDGSSDETWSAMMEMKEACLARFRRVEFTQAPNAGVCLTLNRLLEAARGAYIYRLDSDDLAKPEAVATLRDFLEANPAYGLAVGDDELIDSQGRRFYWTEKRRVVYSPDQAAYLTFAGFLKKMRPEINFDSDDFGDYRSLLSGNYVPGGYLTRKSLTDQIRYTPLAPLEDHYFMMQVAKAAKLKFIDQILYSYRWHDNNTVTRRRSSRSAARQTMKYELENLASADDPELARLARLKLEGVRKKSKFRLGGLLELCRMSYVDRDEYVLKIGNKHFILKTVA
jgi:Glycosyltransferases involved in cell wall biogenesis